jgi:two-component system nitrate/nitrite response regulator NarL
VRILICSKQPMLVTALTDRLRTTGDDVVSIVGAVHWAHADLRQHRPDVVITDEWAAGTDHLVEDLDFALLLLSAQAGGPVVDASRRTVLVAERASTLQEIVSLVTGIRAMQAGETPPAPVHSLPTAGSNASRRLARFLSAREREVLSELVRGADTATVARRLNISRSTARDHIQSLLTKMNTHSRIELVSIAVHGGLVDPTTGLWLVDAG